MYMYKFIFDLLTDPLGLPINDLWEYLVLTIIGFFAFTIGWEVSPGGTFGSLIHWLVRLFAFFGLWAVTYAVISDIQWSVSHWVITLCILTGIVLVACTIAWAMRRRSYAWPNK